MAGLDQHGRGAGAETWGRAKTRSSAGTTLARRLLGVTASLSLGLSAALTALAPEAEARSLVRDAEIERTLRRMADPLFRAAGMEPQSIEIFILNDRELNAFVDGGRNMFLHTGLMVQLESPEELMGVIAHEAGHVVAGHGVRRLEAIRAARIQSIASAILGVGVAAAGGGSAGFGVAGAGQETVRRALLRFTRGQEASADQAALQILNRAGVNPQGMLRTLERLEEQQTIFLSGVDPYLLTHPLGRERIRLLRNGVARSPARGARSDPDLVYWHARMRVKIDGFLTGLVSAPVTEYESNELTLYRDAIRLHRRPDPDGAIQKMDELLSLRPQDPFYWELKGQILHESGRGAEAVAPYRRATELAPDEPLIQAGLGEALLTTGRPEDDREALSLLERAALAEPFAPGLRRPLALAYARLGQEGMAAVVTAERLAIIGATRDARRQAERAKALLPVGSPGWLRAEDIASLAGR